MKVRDDFDSRYFEIRLKRGDHLDKLINDSRLCRLLTGAKDGRRFCKWNPENHFKQEVIVTFQYDIRRPKRAIGRRSR